MGLPGVNSVEDFENQLRHRPNHVTRI